METGIGSLLFQPPIAQRWKDGQSLLDVWVHGRKDLEAVLPVYQLREFYRHPADPFRQYLHRNDHTSRVPGYLCSFRRVCGQRRVEVSFLITNAVNFESNDKKDPTPADPRHP